MPNEAGAGCLTSIANGEPDMRILKPILAMLAILAPPLAAHAEGLWDRPFERIVGFGDSLSDPGNVYALTGMQTHAPYGLIPTWPYAIGDNHYTNGPTWLEQMAEALNKPMSGEAAFTTARPYSNYAVGGGRAGPGGTSPGLSEQVAVFLSHNPGMNLGTSLFVIEFGGNDIRAAIEAAIAGNNLGAAAIMQAAIASTAANIQALYAAGARRFLIVSPPNLAVTPAIQWLGIPPLTAAANFFSTSYTAALNATINGLELALPDVSFGRLDIAEQVQNVMSDPAAYGLTNVVSPCLAIGVLVGAVCGNPDEHLFWDGLHPTTAAHGILAAAAVEVVGSSLPPGLAVTN
jgi:phospholipase/lecithinase/hemolysin